MGCMQKYFRCLNFFNDSTYILSCVYYPTTHLFLLECINIVGVIYENENGLGLFAYLNVMRSK